MRKLRKNGASSAVLRGPCTMATEARSQLDNQPGEALPRTSDATMSHVSAILIMLAAADEMSAKDSQGYVYSTESKRINA